MHMCICRYVYIAKYSLSRIVFDNLSMIGDGLESLSKGVRFPGAVVKVVVSSLMWVPKSRKRS